MLAGCYADLDFESLKPLNPLLEGLPIALAQMGIRTADTKAEVLQNSIPNAFMCSKPQHPFWDFALRHIVEKASHNAAVGDTNWDHVEQTAGPGMIYATNEEYTSATGASVPLLPPGSIYPYGIAFGPPFANSTRAFQAMLHCVIYMHYDAGSVVAASLANLCLPLGLN